jgi:hypothetical protein
MAQAPPDPKTLATVDGIAVGLDHVPLAGVSVMLMSIPGLSATAAYPARLPKQSRIPQAGSQFTAWNRAAMR